MGVAVGEAVVVAAGVGEAVVGEAVVVATGVGEAVVGEAVVVATGVGEAVVGEAVVVGKAVVCETVVGDTTDVVGVTEHGANAMSST